MDVRPLFLHFHILTKAPSPADFFHMAEKAAGSYLCIRSSQFHVLKGKPPPAPSFKSHREGWLAWQASQDYQGGDELWAPFPAHQSEREAASLGKQVPQDRESNKYTNLWPYSLCLYVHGQPRVWASVYVPGSSLLRPEHSLCTILVKATVSIRHDRIFMTSHEFTWLGKDPLLSFFTRPEDLVSSIKFHQKNIYIQNEISLENACFSGRNLLQMLKDLLYSSIQQIITKKLQCAQLGVRCYFCNDG